MKRLFPLAAVICLFVLWGCPKEQPEEPVLTPIQTSYTIGADGGSFDISFRTNQVCQIKSSAPSWLTVDSPTKAVTTKAATTAEVTTAAPGTDAPADDVTTAAPTTEPAPSGPLPSPRRAVPKNRNRRPQNIPTCLKMQVPLPIQYLPQARISPSGSAVMWNIK